MNKIYTKSFHLWFKEGFALVYRLSRSVRRRDIKKLFNTKALLMPLHFFTTSTKYEYSRRWTFHYNEKYVKKQIHLWKFNHRKFDTYFSPYTFSEVTRLVRWRRYANKRSFY